MNKKILATISLAGVVGISSFAYADNYVFREPLFGVKASSNVGSEENGSESGEETQESNLTAPTDVIFSEGGDQVSANVGDSGTITIYDESGSQIGQTTSDNNGDFTSSLNPTVTSGDILDITITDGSDTITTTVTVPEGIGEISYAEMCLKEHNGTYSKLLSEMGVFYYAPNDPRNTIEDTIVSAESRHFTGTNNLMYYWKAGPAHLQSRPNVFQLQFGNTTTFGDPDENGLYDTTFTINNGRQFSRGDYIGEKPSGVFFDTEYPDYIIYEIGVTFESLRDDQILTFSGEKTQKYDWCVSNGLETASDKEYSLE